MLIDLYLYVYVLQIVVYPFVIFLLTIVLSVLSRFTNSDYPFGIFKLFFSEIWIFCQLIHGWCVESNQSVISGRLPTIINIVLLIILSMRSGLLCEQVSLRVMLSTSSYAVCSRDRTDQIQSRLHPKQCRTIILSLQCDYATSFIRQPIFFNFKRKLTIQLYNRNIWNECNFPK